MPIARFFTLFKQHWDAGTGRPTTADVRYPAWTAKEFADAMAKCGCPISDDTVRLWCRGVQRRKSLPRDTQKTAILKVFFPATHTNAEMEEAWQQARQSGPTQAAADTANTPDGWQLTVNEATEGLAEIQFHDLETTNQPDRWKLLATPLFDTWELDDADIGLTEAALSITSGYTIAQGSMLGSSARPHAHIRQVAGGARISGPVDGHKRLQGSPVAEEHLAIIEPGQAGADSITLALHAGRRNFQVALPAEANETEDEKAIRDKKQSVLDALIFAEARKDSTGRAILARATRKRVTPD